ncbi:M23 family metallopeptidase [Vallitalea guaymasensis]|uniref:M23 family metallopeptidase n=1 Tax=Vallitalea guaymasensis TaxID=1185412 RepID=UPI00272CBF37|nr:M23 family metallopeptidase [Vallitalea guaymasensis]
MKLKNIIAYIKRKQFYFALFTCCVTLFLIAILVWVRPKEEEQEIANLNSDVVSNESTDELTSNLVENDETDNEELEPNEDFTENDYEENDTVEAINPITINTEEVVGEGDYGDPDTYEEHLAPELIAQEKPVMVEIAPVVKPNISYNADKEKMIWPVEGDILIPFSMDTPVYFKTLDQYKINPALFIAANVGNDVKVAAEGVVETIKNEPESGMTVTIYHGNGYKTTYGQLNKQLSVKEGDLVKKGQVIGQVDKPSKYHVLLASHLYFKVTNNEKPIDPTKLIK